MIAVTNPWARAVDVIYDILKEAQALDKPLLDPAIELLKWDPDPKTTDYITVMPGLLDRARQPHGLDVVVKVGRQLTGMNAEENPLFKITERLAQVLGLVDTFAEQKRTRVVGVQSIPQPEKDDDQAEHYWVGYITFTLLVASGR